MNGNGMTRRQFSQLLGMAGILGLVEPMARIQALADTKRRLSWLASRTAGAEGVWNLAKIEGKIPRDLTGTLYRTAPGQKDSFGASFNHLFDGDPYLAGFSFREGKVTLRAGFLDTPARVEEQKAGKMIYAEFGTRPPQAERFRGKNQPSVNIIAWDGRLLGLSEGGHPSAIDPKTLKFEKFWDFYGTLPPNFSFTAHPKIDPATGEYYAFGLEQGPSMALTVFRMEKNGKLARIASIPQPGFFMIHDMVVTKNYLVFVIPPVKYELRQLLKGQVAIAETIGFFEKEATRFIVVRKDGQGKPVVISDRSSMIFHHGNAFEKDGKIVMDSLVYANGAVLERLANWNKDGYSRENDLGARLTRFTLDLEKGAIDSRTELAEGGEFPRFDSRRTGEDAKYLYFAEANDPSDGSRFTEVVKLEAATGKKKTFSAGKGRTFGEPVFVPKAGKTAEDAGWLLTQGYDGEKDQNFLEIRDAGTLDFAARLWTGIHFPLGFHGNFTTDHFVNG